MDADPYVTCKDIAALIPGGLSFLTIRDRLTKRADFPRPYRIGARRWWRRSAVLEWLESRKEI